MSLQCTLPVLDGLLPAPHEAAVLDLIFVMGCWHAYAKLRLHTEQTLASFRCLTADLGVLLRHFSMVVCNAIKTTELPRERAARIRRTANAASGSTTSGGGPKPKGFNLNTYKLHALGNYPQAIYKGYKVSGTCVDNLLGGVSRAPNTVCTTIILSP